MCMLKYCSKGIPAPGIALDTLEAIRDGELAGTRAKANPFSNTGTFSTSADSTRTRSVEGPIEYTSSRKSERQQDVDSITVPSRKTTLGSARSPILSSKRKHKSHVDLAAHGPVQIACERIPPLVSPYQADLRKGEPLPNPECILSTDELTLLENFWEKFHTRPNALSAPCSYITTKELHQILGMHWISTTWKMAHDMYEEQLMSHEALAGSLKSSEIS
ncbi:hypothetical protein MRB53_016117 [Persea americana]|uniref:Uncharacterized protein n=1 Tax=Persea americana TaxID=3435 RepID=A0ACC2M1W0_PERAE|nr:hypothetical protein MRB53_016117 [Persea americana]